jgi:hypothetical protein
VVVDPELRSQTIEVTGPENLSMNELVERCQAETGVGGTVRHVPRAAMRVASVALPAFNPSLAALIRAALVMDTRDMTAGASRGLDARTGPSA